MSKKSKIKIASPVRSLKSIESKYRRTLNKFGRAMAIAVKEEILVFLKTQESAYVTDSLTADVMAGNLSLINDKFNLLLEDGYEVWDEYKELRDSLLFDSQKKVNKKYFSKDGFADELETIFGKLNRQFTGVISAAFAQNTSRSMVAATSINNKKKFDRSVKVATGIDLGSVIQAEGLEDFIKVNINKNVDLIENLPEEYLTQIKVIVNNGVASGARFSTIAKEIVGKTGANSKLHNRIKTIARNEVQTINSQITLRRSEKLGIKYGIYRTSEDEKVRTCHKEINGDKFEIKKGAWSKSCQKLIQPGITDINCRCSYSPIIEVQ